MSWVYKSCNLCTHWCKAGGYTRVQYPMPYTRTEYHFVDEKIKLKLLKVMKIKKRGSGPPRQVKKFDSFYIARLTHINCKQTPFSQLIHQILRKSFIFLKLFNFHTFHVFFLTTVM